MGKDFSSAFAALREILKRHSDGMIVHVDTPSDFTVITRAIAPQNRPLWFGAVLVTKSAVTYHLYPLYFNPALQAAVPAALEPRKQGKTCFNFQRPDAELFAQIEDLTRLGRLHYERCGFLKPGPLSQEQLETALRAGGEDSAAIARQRKLKGKQAAVKRAATLKKKKKAAGRGREKSK